MTTTLLKQLEWKNFLENTPKTGETYYIFTNENEIILAKFVAKVPSVGDIFQAKNFEKVFRPNVDNSVIAFAEIPQNL